MDDRIQRSRQAAIDVLKPRPAQLDHGLELHAASIVCDSFGFMPRSAPDAEVLGRLVQAGASPVEYRDALEEMLMIGCLARPSEREEFERAWEAAGVTCLFVCAGEESQEAARLIKRMARVTYLADRMPELLARVSTPEDIAACKQNGRRCLYPVSDAVPLPRQWLSVEEELEHIRVFFQLGYRMMHLTYNRRNPIGDGCGEPADGGLSDFGATVVAEMNRVGLMVDVAHSGQRTSREAAERSSYPVVASHTTCQALHPHIRGKADDVIRAIADSGGYVGICAIGSFLGRGHNVEALLDHVDHVAQNFGVDHVAIGTDVDYVPSGYDDAVRLTPDRPPTRRGWGHLWPGDSFYYEDRERPQDLLSLAWTNWPLFTVGLVQRGYSDTDIVKIIGGNALRVAGQVIAADRGNGTETV